MEYEVFGRVSIGVLKSVKEAVIIDSGIDENDIRKVINNLVKDNFSILGVYLTHSHSDHSGGASFANKRGLKVWCSKIEADLIMNPSLLNVVISGFFNELFSNSKFVTPPQARIEYVTDSFNVGNEKVQLIDLKGHTLGQVGYQIKDVLFAGDSVFSIETLDKHPIPYILDVTNFLKTLDKLRDFNGKIIVSHGGLLDDISKTVDFNISRVKEIIDLFRDYSVGGRFIQDIVTHALNHFVTDRNPLNYFLDSTTIKSIAFTYGKATYKEGSIFIEPIS